MTFESEFLLPFDNVKIKSKELYPVFFFFAKISFCLLFCMGVHLGRSH